MSIPWLMSIPSCALAPLCMSISPMNLPIVSLNKFGLTLEKYSTGLFSLGSASLLKSLVAFRLFDDAFTLATH
ncbi:hypothetical protein D3C76_1335480 [compost metagenome]